MLLNIETKDFCYSIDDDDGRKERLYIFSREYELEERGIRELVSVFIKTVIKENAYAIIVSFHEPEREVKKLFI